MLDAMKKKGYTASVGGVELTDGAAFQKFPEFKQLTELAQGGEDVAIPVVVSKEGANDVTYELVVSYPDRTLRIPWRTPVMTSPLTPQTRNWRRQRSPSPELWK